MRITFILLVFLFLSCNGQEKSKGISTNKTENIVESKTLSYSDWYSSILGAVKSDSLVESYVKNNILQTIKSVSEEKYHSLKQTSKEVKSNKEFKDLFVFHYFEGEVVVNNLYYFFSDGSTSKKARLNISSGKVNKPTVITQDTFIEIDILPVNDENQYQDIIIITDFKKDKVISNLGNPNDILAKSLD